MTESQLLESVYALCGGEKSSVDALIRVQLLPAAVRFAAENAFVTAYPEDKHSERVRKALKDLNEHEELRLEDEA
jgi:hypothetical protein